MGGKARLENWGIDLKTRRGSTPPLQFDLKLGPQSDVLQTTQLVTSLVTTLASALQALLINTNWRT